jgi:hypothetical protein
MRCHRAVFPLVIERSGNNKTPLYFFEVLNNGCLFPQLPISAIERKSFLSVSVFIGVSFFRHFLGRPRFLLPIVVFSYTDFGISELYILKQFYPLASIIHKKLFKLNKISS